MLRSAPRRISTVVPSGLLSESGGALDPFRCELNRLADGFKEATFIGSTGSCYIESSAVIDRGPHHWQTDSDVYARLESEDLHRPMALIVVHGYHQVEVAALRAIEERVSRQRALHVPATVAARLDCRHDLFFFFTVSEEAVLSSMRIYAAYPDMGIRDAGFLECILAPCDRAFYKTGLDARDRIDEPDVRGYVQHLQFWGGQHHRNFRCSCEVCKNFGVAGKFVPCRLQRLLV